MPGTVVAEQRRILGQSNPAATTSTALYTVPAGVQATVHAIIICNQAGSGGTFRVSLAIAGATLATSQYLYFDTTIAANATTIATFGDGVTLSQTDVIRVYASSASQSFTAVGVERGGGL